MLNSWFYLFIVGEKSKEREAYKADADIKLQGVVVQTQEKCFTNSTMLYLMGNEEQ